MFSLQKGVIGEPVRSDFGVHIVEVTDIKPSSVKPFEAVRAEILAELRAQEAGRRFAELAEQFSNTVYEQPDSLQPAAEALGLKTATTDWISRDSAPAPLADERVISALFGDEAVQKSRNTEAIEIGNGTLVSARVKAFEPARRLPLDEVRERIVELVRIEQGRVKATRAGEEMLAALRRGEQAAARWGEARKLQRGAPGLPAAAMQAVFSASAETLPVHVGVQSTEGDYVLYRIEAVERAQIGDADPRVAAVTGQYKQLLAGRDFGAFLSELRQRYEVTINPTALQVEPR